MQRDPLSWQGCLTFVIQHKMKPPLQSTRGFVSDCLRLQGEGKLNYLESQHCPAHALCWWAGGHSQDRLRAGAQRAGKGQRASTGGWREQGQAG